MTSDLSGLSSRQRELFERLLAQRGVAPPAAAPVLAHDAAQRHAPFPLTDVQAGYYFGRSASVELGNVASHGYHELEIAALDLPRYERAWNLVIARHDMLRAIVLPDATQVVLECVPPFRVDVADLRELSESERQHELATTREQMSHRVPDPGRWPMYRVRVSQLEGERARIHFSSDALLTDIFSAAIFQAELRALYEDPHRVLPEQALTFRDYVMFSKSLEQTESWSTSWRYWQDKVAALPPAPELPLRCALAAIEEPRFERHGFTLSRAHSEQLRAQAQSHSLTPSVLLLTAYAELLRRFGQRDAMTLNVTVFQRPGQAGMEHVVGDFTSTMLFAVPSEGEDFASRCRHTQRALLEDLEHAQVSGVRVLREYTRLRGQTGQALMPVVFTSMLGIGAIGQRLAASDTLGELSFMLTQTPQVLLDHQLYENADGSLAIVWDVVAQAFAPGVLEAMLRAYEALLQRLATDPSTFLATRDIVPLCERDEAARTLANETSVARDPELLQAAFWRACAVQPEREALVSGSTRLTYGQLGAAVLQTARRLREVGALRGDLIAIVMERGWEQVVAALAVLEAGCAYVPIDALLPELRITQLLEESGCRYVLTQPRVAARATSLGQCRQLLVEPRASSSELAARREPPACTPEDVAYVIYTSGSTGVPKGVVMSHAAAFNTLADINQRFCVRASDRLLGLSSLSFDLSVYDLFGVLGSGACLVQVEHEQQKNPRHWAMLLEREQVTLWNSVPALLQMLVDELEANTKQKTVLRTALLSGDWIPLALVERAHQLLPACELVSLGGATEAAIWSIFHRIPRASRSEEWSSVPYGRPLENQRWHVLNERHEPCPVGVSGELYIAGDGLARGYLRDEARTAQRFVPHQQTGERLYRTGDWGRYREGGLLEFLGRQDSQVKVGGHRVELGEIEAALASHPEVRDVVVEARGEVRSASKQLIGYVVSKAPASCREAALLAHVRQFLPEYMVPLSIVFLPSLPLSTNGKVDRQALPAPVVQAHPSRANTGTERALLEVLSEQLGTGDVSTVASFFELGISSVELVRLQASIERKTGRALSVLALFDHPTIERLALYLDGATSGDDEALDRALRPGTAKRRVRAVRSDASDDFSAE